MNIFKRLIVICYAEPFKVNQRQKLIRDREFDLCKSEIKEGATLLDIGCGAGYEMLRARKELNCNVHGIDVKPYVAGVKEEQSEVLDIREAGMENIPFEDDKFDVVLLSHVLQYINDSKKGFEEVSRVLKPDGVFIIGVPSSSIVMFRILFEYLILIPFKIPFLLFKRWLNVPRKSFQETFIPGGSVSINPTVFDDYKSYQYSKWKKLIESSYTIEKVKFPAFYTYPDFNPFFFSQSLKSKVLSGSYYFICRAK